MTDSQRRLVVIGNGMAGVAAVDDVLKLKTDIPVTIFGDEPHVNYNRILLSDVLAGKRSMREIVLNPREWYEKNNIDLRTGTPVTAIDPNRKVVVDAGGAETPYDKLLIAVGGSPFVPPIAGTDREGVLTFRSLDDCERILQYAGRSSKAVVVGGGLLGLEAARALINHGLGVTVVHLVDRLMELQLDDVGAEILKRSIERMGIDVMLTNTLTEIMGNGRVTGVRLKSGQALDADIVLVCTGIRPNLALAKVAGLSTNRGIIVDDRMQSSHPDIFAVGDVVEHRGVVYGFIDPIREQARVVADAMFGSGKLRYEGTVCATVLKVAGVSLTSAGRFLGGPGYEDLVFIDSAKGIYKKIVLQRNQVAGMILLGNNKDGQEIFNFMKSRQDMSQKRMRMQQILNDPAAAAAAPGAGPTMADTDQVCNCNVVTKGTIVKAIREKACKTVDDIARHTKASTGCGSCASLCERILKETLGATDKPDTAAPERTERPMDVPRRYPRVLPVEKIKQEGLALNWEKIVGQGVFALSEDDYYRLKTYGVCSQKHPGFFMMRIRIPGGKVTTKQLEALADCAEAHGRGWGHLTTRQDMELHWVKVEEVPTIWEKLWSAGISTRSSCGHTLRNVAACPHSEFSPDSPIYSQRWAESISTHFIQRSEFINSRMPNRLNIFFGGCPECAAEAQINDIGFVPVRRDGGTTDDPLLPPGEKAGMRGELGFEVWVGGSLGANPMLGFKIRDFVTPQEVLPVCQTVFEIHMKHGMREKGKSRLKFLIEKWGREKFIAEFEKVFAEKNNLPENMAFPIPESKPDPVSDGDPAFMCVELDITLGEIPAWQIREVAALVKRHGRGEACFTKEQEIEIPWVKTSAINSLKADLEKAGLRMKDRARSLRVTSCVGTEFCILAATNSQGAARDILKTYAPENTAKRNLLNGLTVSVSGCPNSCAKQQVADIGLVGSMGAVGEEKRFTYTLSIGGTIGADATGKPRVSIGQTVRKRVTEEMVVPTLDALLDVALELRNAGETFPQTMMRLGAANVEKMLDARLSDRAPIARRRVGLIAEKADAA